MTRPMFTSGGTVQAGDGIYLERKADQELLNLCQTGNFVYILTPRQMGKSSLMVRTAQTLASQGIQSVIIDLTQIGTELSADEWYLGFLTLIEDQLDLETDVAAWWESKAKLGVTQRLTQFFQTVLLKETDKSVVLFVDEIDTTLGLDFTDDFFTAIRFLYVARAHQPEMKRLSVVLIGVATPGDLIQDSRRTPFNIGHRVDLTDFTVEEAMPLAAGFGLSDAEAQGLLGKVLAWTGGHPYLTQRLCETLVNERSGPFEDVDLDRAVGQTFLGERSEQENNLQFVRDMLTKRAPEPQKLVLETYRKIYRDKAAVPDEEQSLAKSHLKLAGVVRLDGHHLKVRNPIYREVFNFQWIQNHWPETRWQRIKPAIPLVTILLGFSIITSFVAIYADGQRRKAEHIANIAQLREQSSSTLYWLTSSYPTFGLVLAIDTMDRGQSIPEVEVVAQSALLKSIQRVQEVNLLQGHQGVESVSFSPDSKRIVSGSWDKTVHIWDAQSGQPIGKPLLGHKDAILSVAFSPDGKRIASGSRDNTLRIWDAQSGQPIGEPLLGHQSYIYSVCFSPDGKHIVSGSRDNTLRIWDAQSGQPIGEPLLGHKDGVKSVSFSPDGKRIVSGSFDNTVRIWDTQSGQPIGKPLQGHQDAILSVAFSPDGTRIVSGSFDKTIRIWDVQSGQLLGRPLQGHQDYVDSVSFSPDGKRIVSGSWDKTVRIWDAQSGQPIGEPLQGHQDGVKLVSFSPDGRSIVSGSGDDTVRIWDVQSGQLMGVPLQGHQDFVRSVSFSPDGKRIVSGSNDKTVRLWDVQSGQLIGKPLHGHKEAVNSVSFSPDGKRIVSGSNDKTVRLWDVQSGQPIGKPLHGHKEAVNSVSFSPDGKRIVSGSNDKTVRLWDAQSGQPIGEPLQGVQNSIYMVSISPNGKQIIIAGLDGIHIWEAQSGRPIGELVQGAQHHAISASFSPDGKRIVSGGFDKTVRIWDAQSGQPIGEPLLGHQDYVDSVSFSPDGKRIVSGSWDKTVRIWDAQSGQPIGEPLLGHQDGVSSVSFSPNGKRIVSGSNDKTARIWEVGPEALTQLACKRLRLHPLLHQPDKVTSDPSIIEAANRSKAVCKQHFPAWDSYRTSQPRFPKWPFNRF